MSDPNARPLAESNLFKSRVPFFNSLAELKAGTKGGTCHLLTSTSFFGYTFVSGDFTGKIDDVNFVSLDNVPITSGVMRKIESTLYAGNFGVIGDGKTDDTVAAQNFLNICQSLSRGAYFGALFVKVSGPLRATNTNVVFDQAALFTTLPGFYPTGQGYTTLTVVGSVSDFVVSVFGSGTIEYNADGTVKTDTRPRVNGIAFGDEATGIPFAASVMRSARAYMLAGFGIRHQVCWDTTFLAESVEHCGLRGSNGFFAWTAEGSSGANCNENTWVRIQVELSDGRSSYVSPFTLSCTFTKFHTERAWGEPGTLTWQFGPGVFDSCRMSAMVPSRASALVLAQAGSYRALRCEGVPLQVSSNGGIVEFHASEGTIFTPAPASNGEVLISGGNTMLVGITSGWMINGGRHTLSVGPCSVNVPVRAEAAKITTLTQLDVTSRFIASNCQIDAIYGGNWGELRLAGMTRAVPNGGTLGLSFGKLWIDENTTLDGNIAVNNVGARINGLVTGNYTYVSSRQTLFGPTAEVGGQIINHGPPESALYLDGWKEGMYCKNMKGELLGVAGSQYIVHGWQYMVGALRECRFLTGS